MSDMPEPRIVPAPELRSGPNFEAVDLGQFAQLHRFATHLPQFPRPAVGKVFLGPLLKLSGMEVSINRAPAGAAIPFLHRHQEHEELYIFVGGSGQIQIDGQILSVQEGSAVRVRPAGARAWRNNSTEDLYFICVQATQGTYDGGPIGDGEVIGDKPQW
jgi:mannose-6-phosphate isomerase-like protein (cupin superfamily)